MKKIIFPLIAMVAFSHTAFPVPDKKGQHMQRMIEELQLDEKQTESFRQIMREQREKHQAVMKEIIEQARPKMEAIHSETIQRLTPVLNEEQLKKFEEAIQARRERIRKRLQQNE